MTIATEEVEVEEKKRVKGVEALHGDRECMRNPRDYLTVLLDDRAPKKSRWLQEPPTPRTRPACSGLPMAVVRISSRPWETNDPWVVYSTKPSCNILTIKTEDDPISTLLTILPRLRKRPIQLQWDIRVFGVDSSDVPLYIFLPDALEIVGGNSMLNISIIQLWATRKMLSALATRWRDFKTFLTREYVFGERQNETLCLKYQITDEEWMQFRATRLDPSWQAKRIAAQERQAKNDAPHLLSRGGYERKKKEMKKARAEATGVESADRVESPPRHEMWIAARTKSDGQMTSESARVVADKIGHVWTRVVVDQVQDVAAPVPLPNTEVQLVGQATGTFLAWPKRLVMPLSARAKVMREPHVDHGNILETEDDPISTLLTILPRLRKRPIQLQWDIRVFGVDSSDVPLYIFLPDALEIVGGNSMLNISIIQLWATYMDKLSVEQAQAQVYGFIEPQSIQKSGNTQVHIQQYMQTWMSESGRDIYNAPYIDESHWQLMVIIPKEYTVVWFCSLHRKPSHEIKCQLQG
uniref:Uncharacterized protein n=1 Tax=Cajanus cajan TaxID=3821 RepID=A0A151RI47_CAJCA|nr:hypothetical protein KK1_036335 [Cajanus cajan]